MSKIEWTEKTWNPLAGCDKVSAGCKHCYAMYMAWRLMHMGQKKYEGTVEKTAGGQINWTGKINFDYDALRIPFINKKPTVYFVNSMSDLFHKDVPFDFIYKVFEMMHLAHWHTFQVLTKRAERLDELQDVWFHLKRNYPDAEFPSKNVWLGVSVENQAAADERIHYLSQAPAAVRFLSCEPLLGSIEFSKTISVYREPVIPSLSSRVRRTINYLKNIDWVIVGGESGNEARPMHPDWARSIRDQCIAAGVPFFFKQWGEWKEGVSENENLKHGSFNSDGRFDEVGYHTACYCDNCVAGEQVMHRIGKKTAGRMLDGRTWSEFPQPP